MNPVRSHSTYMHEEVIKNNNHNKIYRPRFNWSASNGMKKLILILIILSAVFTPKAHAQLVVQPVSTALIKSPLEIAFDIVKTRIFNMMVDQIVDYINGNGKPQFVTDWRGFLDQTVQIAIGDIVQQLGLGALCSPFRFQVQVAMVAPPRFSKQITCTLGSIVRNVNNFYSDFRNGGWLAYQEMWAPNNNFYGSLLLAWNAKENEIASRVAAAQNEALASRGFLSAKKCAKDPVTGRDIPSTCVIVTPGTAVGDLASKALGADLDFIINSKDLAAYVAAISDALINRFMRAGVQGLGGVVTPSRPPQNYNTGIGCDAFVGSAKSDCLNYQYNYGSSYTKASQITFAQIDAVLQPRLVAKTILDNLIAQERQGISQLNYLVCPSLINQQQQNLFRHQQSQDENNYIISQLTRAAQDIGRSSSDNFGGLFLTQQMTNVPAAQKLLSDIQAEQAAYQPIQPSQCQSR